MTPEQLRDLLPDFALGLLDDELAVEVVRYLRGSAAARAEARLYVQAAEALALSAPTIPPLPPETVDRIRRYVHARDGHSGEPARGAHAREEEAREPAAPVEDRDEDDEDVEVEQDRPRRGLFGRFRRAPREEADEVEPDNRESLRALAIAAPSARHGGAAIAGEAAAPPKHGLFRRRYEPDDDEEEDALPVPRPAPLAGRKPADGEIDAPFEAEPASPQDAPEVEGDAFTEAAGGAILEPEPEASPSEPGAEAEAEAVLPPPAEEAEEPPWSAGEQPVVANDAPLPEAVESAAGAPVFALHDGAAGEVEESGAIAEGVPDANDAPAWGFAPVAGREESSALSARTPEEQAPPLEAHQEQAAPDAPAEPQFDGWAPEPATAAELSPFAEAWAPELSFASTPDTPARPADAPAALAGATPREPAAAAIPAQGPPLELREPPAPPAEVERPTLPAFSPATDVPGSGKRGFFRRGSRSPVPVEEDELDEQEFADDEEKEEEEKRGRRFLGLFGGARSRDATPVHDATTDEDEEEDDEEWEDEDEPVSAGSWKPAALLLGFLSIALFGTAVFLFVAYHNASQASDQAKSQRDARPLQYSLLPQDPPAGDDGQKPYVSAEVFVPAPPRQSVMILNGWPNNKRGETYQLWAETAGGKFIFVVAFFANSVVVPFGSVPQDTTRVFITVGPVRQTSDPLPTAPVGPRWAESNLVDIRK